MAEVKRLPQSWIFVILMICFIAGCEEKTVNTYDTYNYGVCGNDTEICQCQDIVLQDLQDVREEEVIPIFDVYDVPEVKDAEVPKDLGGDEFPFIDIVDVCEVPDLNEVAGETAPSDLPQDAYPELDLPAVDICETPEAEDAEAPKDLAGDVSPETTAICGSTEPKVKQNVGNRFLITGGMVVTVGENDELKIIPKGKVLFENDTIACVGEANNPCPITGDETVIELPSCYKVYPGLIDPHNHPHYNAFPLFEHPGSDYKNDENWGGAAEYKKWKHQYYIPNDDLGNDCQMTQYGILRALAGGATAIQAVTKTNKCFRFSKDKPWILRQIDTFNGITPDKVKTSTLGVGSEADAAKICEEEDSGKWDRFIIHLSEGKQGDPTALKEFTNLQNWAGGCLLNEKLVAIHCNAFEQEHFEAFAPSGATIVWSPSCHMDLYGETEDATLNVPAALALGIPVALGPDWYASHGIGMITEINKARELSGKFFNGEITDEQIFRMATDAGAKVAALENQIGRLLPGMKADITIVAGKTADPFEPAYLGEIAGVFVDGILYYGDQLIMTTQNVPNPSCEDLEVCGVSKTICLPPTYAGTTPTYSSIKDSFIKVPDPKNQPDVTELFSAVPFDELPEACGK